jgi:hypothetical protein
MLRAKSSDLNVVKQPWNLSNAQTSAPISNNGGLVEKQGGFGDQEKQENELTY